MPPQEFDPAWILFQGSGTLAVNKPSGVPVHAGTGHELGLAEMLDLWIRMNPGVVEIKAGNPVFPVHQLDLEATGVLLFALNKEAARTLHDAFEKQEIKKKYLAVIAGKVEALGHIQGKVRRKHRAEEKMAPAELEFRRIAGDEWLSVVEVVPVGGHTRQIRALFSDAGRPLAGDERYGKPKASRSFLEKMGVSTYLLHASELLLPGNILGGVKRITAPLPEEFLKLLEKKGWKLPARKEPA